VKDRVVGKTKQIIAEIDGDFHLKEEGEAQAKKANYKTMDESKSVFGNLNDVT
jgi:hypothetical protein